MVTLPPDQRRWSRLRRTFQALGQDQPGVLEISLLPQVLAGSGRSCLGHLVATFVETAPKCCWGIINPGSVAMLVAEARSSLGNQFLVM